MVEFKFKAEVEERDGLDGKEYDVKIVSVSPEVDRPHTYGIRTSKPRLRDRLIRAINAGVITENPSLKTDVDGKTYVCFSSAVMGRYLNADLKRLGY